MDPFATADDVATRLGLTLSGTQSAQVTAFLCDASTQIREYLRQDVNLVTGDVITVQSPDGPWLELPQWPIAAVGQICVNGQAVSDWTVVGRRVYRLYGWQWPSVDVIPPLALYGLMSTTTVTYDHGWAVVPDAVAGACRQMVMRALLNLPGYTSVALDDFRAAYSPGDAGFGVRMSDADKRAVKRYGARSFTVDMGGTPYFPAAQW